jgi:methionyl-tRNA formyltransferase
MFNVVFLGNRRISQGALSVLGEDEFVRDFRVRAVVSDEDCFRAAGAKINLTGIPFISNARRNEDQIADIIVREKIDLLLSVQHIWILPASILQLVGGNAFNLHNSALPEYKGYNTISHAIIDGVKEFRTTIHWMAAEVDTGDIAFQGSVPILDTDTAMSVYLKSVEVAVEQFKALLRSLKKGGTPRIPLKGTGRVYGRRELDALKNLSRIEDPALIDRIVRASFFPPAEPAYQIVNGKKLHLLPPGGYEYLARHVGPANAPA